MKITEAMRKYRLPNPTTPEDLECRWSKVLNFGDKVLLAGYYYNVQNKPSYFGAVYEYLEDGRKTCESPIGLCAACEIEFEDDGHAIAWAMVRRSEKKPNTLGTEPHGAVSHIHTLRIAAAVEKFIISMYNNSQENRDLYA